MATSLNPFFSNLLIISPTRPRWTASGLSIIKVLSLLADIIFNIFRLWDNQYFHIQIFYFWYFLKARVGDVCRVLMKIFVKWETNSRDFQIISEKFPGKRERILCAEIWHLVCTEAWEPPCLRSFLHTSSGDESRSNPWPESKNCIFYFLASESFQTRYDSYTETP